MADEEKKIVTLKDLDNPEPTPKPEEKEEKPEEKLEEKEKEEQEEEREEGKNEELISSLVDKAEKDPQSLTDDEIKILKDSGVIIENDDENQEDYSEFFSAVESITGEELSVDFGDTPPTTPEGMVKYLTKFREQGIEEYEAALKEKAPRAYQAMLIEVGGGNPSEYFLPEDQDTTDYKSYELKDDDIDSQKLLIRRAYSYQGLDDETITRLVEISEDKDSLKSDSEKALNYLKSTQEERETKAQESVKLKKERDMNTMSSFVTELDSIISEGSLSSFKIPNADKTEFAKYVKQNITYNDGKFYSTEEVKSDNLNNVLSNLFFKFKGGDLDKLIKNKAKSERVKELRISLETKPSTASSNKTPRKKIITLGEIDNYKK